MEYVLAIIVPFYLPGFAFGGLNIEKDGGSVWPSNNPKFTNSFLPAAIQVILIYEQMLLDELSYRKIKSDQTYSFTKFSGINEKGNYSNNSMESSCEIVSEPTTILTELTTTAEVDLTVENVTQPDYYETNDPSPINESENDGKVDQEHVSPSVDENGFAEELTISALALADLLQSLIEEAQYQHFEKIQGFSDNLIRTLTLTSRKSARNQLRFILNRTLKRGDVKLEECTKLVKSVLRTLNEKESPLSRYLDVVTPVKFS